MYLWVPCPPDVSSTDFALSVLERHRRCGDARKCVSAKGGEGYVRISLIADCDRLGEAMNRLRQAEYPLYTGNCEGVIGAWKR